MPAPFAFLRVQTDDHVATITLDRPPLNVLTIAMIRELETALDDNAADQHLKAVVLRTECRAFCAAVDGADQWPERVEAMLRGFSRLFAHLRAFPAPTIAVVHGAALGGGTELAMACDLVLAGASARFGQPEIRLGVFPPIAAAFFPQIMGYQEAAHLLFTGASIAADEAARLRLVTMVAPDEELMVSLNTLLNQLRALSAATLRLTKRALRYGADLGGAASLEFIETLYLTNLMATDDASEGINAFIEKRQPAWRDA
jgi:cyclohexa-1,5-dienecarbonyl-CoA hydratase